jgi:predicted permease
MPAGFRFPVNHRYWAPMRLDPGDYELGAGPQLYLFARLAPGVSIAEARAELATIGPAERERRPDLKPQVLPYTDPYFDLDEPGTAMMLYGMQAAITLLLVVVAVNVSVLVYARTAARTGEIAVRTALGATRRRVVGQLFAEALVLSGVAAAVGLAIAQAALTVVIGYMGKGDGPELPFWVDLGFSPGLALYVVGVAVLASVIVGVLPALQATGRNVHSGLKELSTRGSRMQLGRTWTTLIVAQVALAVAVLPYAGYIAAQGLQRGTAAARFPVDEIIRAEVTLQGDAPPPSMNAATYERTLDATFLHRAEELVRRLEAEPEVAGVTFASQFPGEELMDRVEAEGGATHNVRRSHVDVDMLGTMGVSMLAGRGLTASDVREDVREDVRDVARDTMRVDSRDEATVALVNPALAEWLGTTGSTLGRRIRVIRSVQDASGAWRDEVGSWLEVVGVMPDFTVQVDFDPTNAKLYIPTSLAGAVADGRSVSLAVRLRGGNAAAFAGRFRAVAADLDPALQLEDLRTAASLQWEAQVTLRLMGLAIAIVTLSVLLLSAAGIYAMMAFTVARRRREIGIRAALGADARRVLSGIFWRAGAQIGTGVLVGVLLAVALNQVVGNGMLIHDRVLAGERVLLLPMAAAIMLAIGLLAALGPARQGLRVQPTEALREE